MPDDKTIKKQTTTQWAYRLVQTPSKIAGTPPTESLELVEKTVMTQEFEFAKGAADDA